MKIKQLVEKHEKYVIKMRREFHMYPEVSYEEVRTSRRVREELDEMGVSYVSIEPNIVVATIEGSEEGKTLAIRADMDALPMEELTDMPFKSKHKGVMHSCGHDAHTAILLGTVKVLSEIKNQIKGTVKFCFQSAEEVGGGAKETLEHLESVGGVDQVISMHVWSGIKSGFISIEPGGRMAGGNSWEVEVIGKGGHGSRPDQCVDPIKPAADIVLKLSSIPSNRYNVLEPCVVSTGQIKAGTMGNIIPERAIIQGSYRYFSYEGKSILEEIITEISEFTAKSYGAEAKVTFKGGVPPVINHEAPVGFAKQIVEEMDGLKTDEFEPICASENFGYYLQRYPGFMAFLGIANTEKDSVYPQHHPKFNIDEDVLKYGCEFFVRYVCEYLK